MNTKQTTKKQYMVEYTETRTAVFEMDEKEMEKHIEQGNAYAFIHEIKQIADHNDLDDSNISHLQEHTVEAKKSLW